MEDDRLLAVGGCDVEQLAAEHGTPLWVLDRAELMGRARGYRAAFGPEVAVIYAAKALCVVGVLQLLAAEGLHVDVASAGELATALRAGVPGERLVFHGNNKSPEELRAGLAAGVARFVVDNATELERLDALGRERGRAIDVQLRVTPGVEVDTHHAIATGRDDAKFGFCLRTGAALEGIAAALSAPGLRLRGLHAHVGSQLLDAEPSIRAAEALVDVLDQVRSRHGVVLRELDLGGGLGVDYTGEVEVELERFASTLIAAVASRCARHGLAVPSLSVEPGRSIAAPAGLTLYEVGDVKDVPGVRTFAAVDGGMSDNLRPALYGARYTAAAAGRRQHGETGTRSYRLAGKHCESGDVHAADVDLPADLAPGDLVALAVTGAYHHSMASNYNRVPRPAMVLVADGTSQVLVRRETVADVLAHDVVLPTPIGARGARS